MEMKDPPRSQESERSKAVGHIEKLKNTLDVRDGGSRELKDGLMAACLKD